ncbi:MAG TPA: hypothetical protein VGH43_03475 [Jatrophihabitans sp.]|jgi:hypothetical protein
MDQKIALRDDELVAESLELLPARETLWGINVSNVIGVNISLAVNAASIGASASSFAGQQFLSVQH